MSKSQNPADQTPKQTKTNFLKIFPRNNQNMKNIAGKSKRSKERSRATHPLLLRRVRSLRLFALSLSLKGTKFSSEVLDFSFVLVETGLEKFLNPFHKKNVNK